MTGLEKECNRVAKILKSFVEKGRIPPEVIANAKGIAIYTAFRAAMYVAGGGGAGVVMARLPDGSWSAPSAFTVVAGSFGVVIGLDVYDCVCVLNTQEAVDVYTKSEATMGASTMLAAGPIGGTADLSTKDIKPIWTYTKSMGLYGGLTVDGTVIKERSSVNADAYGSKLSAAQILKGEAKWPASTKLPDVLRLAEGKSADAKAVGSGVKAEATPAVAV